MECNSNYRILNNQVKIPCAAFGTYKAAEGNSADIIGTAIRAGYRHFDTASVYGTEKYVAEAIEKSRIPRQEFFLTSKVWKEDMGYEQTKAAFAKTLEQLNTDYLDVSDPLATAHVGLQKLEGTGFRELESNGRIVSCRKDPRHWGEQFSAAPH